MKYIAFIGIFCLLSFGAAAQNLVPNWSFEDMVQCPWAQSQLNLATGWINPTGGTADYWHSCWSSIMTQQARTGQGFAGIYTYTPPNYDIREYIQIELSDTLINGKKYCVSFYVNRHEWSEYACNSIGAYFSNTPISSSNSNNLPFIPQVENVSTNELLDTVGWVKVEGQFIANGNEKFLTIGNFRNDITSFAYFVDSSNVPHYPYSYYLIDDVSVEECPSDTATLNIPNVFTPNGDGVNDLFTIQSEAIENMTCVVFNRWGVKVAEFKQPGQGWDGRTISGQDAAEGVYYYILSGMRVNGEAIHEKGFLQLLR